MKVSRMSVVSSLHSWRDGEPFSETASLKSIRFGTGVGVGGDPKK